MPSSVPPEILVEARHYGVELDSALGAQLTSYLELLLETNQAFNLTAITDLAEAWPKHILDSLSLAPVLRGLPEGSAIVDVGSGGGLPAIPLACCFPALRFTLLEATAKKARFLGEAAEHLGLNNVLVENDRAESFGRADGRERFDVATSRALSRLPVLLELTLPLLKVGGMSLAIKGERAEQEIAEAERALLTLCGTVEHSERTSTGVVIHVRKLGETPPRYPRRAGEPKRSPL